MQVTIKQLYIGILFFWICFMFIGRIGLYAVACLVKNRKPIESIMTLYNIALYSLIVFMILAAEFYE